MEHRAGARIQIEQMAILDCTRAGGTTVTLREINLSGMLIDSPMMFLPLYASVMLAFSLTVAGRRHDFLLDAMVIRHTPDGAALMLSDLDPATLRTLADALYGYRSIRKSHAGASRPDYSPSLQQAHSG